jgi:hypothetical protein
MRQLQRRASLATSTCPAPAMTQRSQPPAPRPGSRSRADSAGIGMSLVQQAKKDAAPAPRPLRDVFRTLCVAALGALTTDTRAAKQLPTVQDKAETHAGQTDLPAGPPTRDTDRRRS